jgi:hypothetical protein
VIFLNADFIVCLVTDTPLFPAKKQITALNTYSTSGSICTLLFFDKIGIGDGISNTG